MGVDTHGIEAIRNSAENISGDIPGNTFLKTLDGWIFHRVGRKVVVTYPSATVEVFTFQQQDEEIYTISVTYTNSTKDFISEVERIA